jgi:phage terminase small subunit
MANKPTPTALKKLAGNPGKRPMNDREPLPAGRIGACPDWFPADARLEWDRIVPELDRLGVLTSVDAATVEAHCLTYGEIVATVKAGEPLRAALLGQMRAYAAELGLTPAARAKLVVPQGNDDDPADEFFR